MPDSNKTSFITIAIAFLIATVLMVGILGRQIEKLVFPVTEMGEIVEVNYTGITETSIKFSMQENRKCELQNTKWFLGEYLGRAAFIKTEFNDYSVTEERVLTWNDLRINLPYDLIVENSYAIAYYKCHPLWISESLIYINEQSYK